MYNVLKKVFYNEKTNKLVIQGSSPYEVLEEDKIGTRIFTEISDVASGIIQGSYDTINDLPLAPISGSLYKVGQKIFEATYVDGSLVWDRFLHAPNTFNSLSDKGIDDTGISSDKLWSSSQISKELAKKAEVEHTHRYESCLKFKNLDLKSEEIIELHRFDRDIVLTYAVIILTDIDNLITQPTVSIIDNDGDLISEEQLNLTEIGQCFSLTGFPKSINEKDSLYLRVDTVADATSYKIVLAITYIHI